MLCGLWSCIIQCLNPKWSKITVTHLYTVSTEIKVIIHGKQIRRVQNAVFVSNWLCRFNTRDTMTDIVTYADGLEIFMNYYGCSVTIILCWDYRSVQNVQSYYIILHQSMTILYTHTGSAQYYTVQNGFMRFALHRKSVQQLYFLAEKT